MKDYIHTSHNTTNTKTNLRATFDNHSKYFLDQTYQFSKKLTPTANTTQNTLKNQIRKSPSHNNQDNLLFQKRPQNKYTEDFGHSTSNNKGIFQQLSYKYKKQLDTKKIGDQEDLLTPQSRKNNIKDLRNTTNVIPTFLYNDYKKDEQRTNHVYRSPRKEADYITQNKKSYRSPQRRYEDKTQKQYDYLKSPKLRVPAHSHHYSHLYSPNKYDLTVSNISPSSNNFSKNNPSGLSGSSVNTLGNQISSTSSPSYFNSNNKYEKSSKQYQSISVGNSFKNQVSPKNNQNMIDPLSMSNSASSSQSKKYRLLQLLQKCDKIQAETDIMSKKSPDTRGLLSSNQNQWEKQKTLKQLRQKYKQYLQPPQNSKLYTSTNSMLSTASTLSQSSHPTIQNSYSIPSYDIKISDNSIKSPSSNRNNDTKYFNQYKVTNDSKQHRHYDEKDNNKIAQMFKKKKEYFQDISTPQHKNIKNIHSSHSNNHHSHSGVKGQHSNSNSKITTPNNNNVQNTSKLSTFTKKQIQITPKNNNFLNQPIQSNILTSPTTPKRLTNITIDDFAIGKNKGQGKFGIVFIVKHKLTNSLYALKKIQKSVIKSHMMQDQLIRQIKLQSYFNHPNILKLYGFFDDKQHIYLLLQYMEQGTLFEQLKKRKQKLHQKQVSFRIKEIANAIRYLHDLDIAHRDIKPQNIVLSNGVAKICDFGWSTRCQNRRKTYCGTFDYAAPQILQGKQYDWCVDLWCLGVLTFQLLTGKVPFYNISRKETMKKILNVDKNQIEFPNDISWQAKDFVECLVKKDPHERKRADELFDHPFLQKYTEQHKYF